MIHLEQYISKPELNFVVNGDNETYYDKLSDEEIDFIEAVVAAESDQSKDDALAVISVILNRCESPRWVRVFGTNPINQIKGKGQFEVYSKGYYKKYLNGNAPDDVKKAVHDALTGIRNNEYLSFRSNNTYDYSNNMISRSGNRYK